MADEKRIRQITDRNRVSARKASNGEKCLMLLKCQARLVSSYLAECLKFPKFVSESRESFIVHGIGSVATT